MGPDHEGYKPKPENSEAVSPIGLRSYEAILPRDAQFPENNQDALIRRNDIGLYAVFDGIGGRRNGKESATVARNTIERELGNAVIGTPEDAEKVVRELLLEASRQVNELTEGDGGTTGTVILIREYNGQRMATVGGVGDSSAFLFSDDELIPIIDTDGGFIRGYLKEVGLTGDKAILEERRIEEKLARVRTKQDFEKLTEMEQVFFNMRNLLRQFLGQGDGVVPNVSTNMLYAGDKVILTTDGVTDNLTPDEMIAIIRQGKLETQATQLVNGAQSVAEGYERNPELYFRGKPDDMTAIVIDLDEFEDDHIENDVSYREKGNEKGDIIADAEAFIDQLPVVEYPREPRKTERHSLDTSIVAREAWLQKNVRKRTRLKHTRDLPPDVAVQIRQGKMQFPEYSSTLSFDPRNLAIGIIAGDATGDASMMQAYYAHKDVDGNTNSRTDFTFTTPDAFRILRTCARSLRWTDTDLKNILIAYIDQNMLDDKSAHTLHRRDAAYDLLDQLQHVQVERIKQDGPERYDLQDGQFIEIENVGNIIDVKLGHGDDDIQIVPRDLITQLMQRWRVPLDRREDTFVIDRHLFYESKGKKGISPISRGEQVILGRIDRNNFNQFSEFVSREHVSIERTKQDKDIITITDLYSRNGTQVHLP